MADKRWDSQGWSIHYPDELCLFGDDRRLLLTSRYSRQILGQLCYCPKEEQWQLRFAGTEIGFRVNDRDISLFFSGYELQVLQKNGILLENED